MRYHNDIEVILPLKDSSTALGQNELVKWLTTTLQPVIDKQQESIEKMFVSIFKEASAIYLS